MAETDLVTPTPVPVSVRVRVALLALDVTVTVSVEVPGPVMLAGLRDVVRPVRPPLTVRATAELKVPKGVRVTT